MTRLLLIALCLVPPAPQAGPDPSPRDLALSPDGRWALVALSGADAVALVDLETGRVAARAPAGSRPFAVAWEGSRAAVSNLLSDDVSFFRVEPPVLAPDGRVEVGDEPRGLVFDGDRLLVALGGDDAVAVVRPGAPVSRAPSGREPWSVVLSKDRTRVAVACARSQEVRIHDAKDLAPIGEVAMRGHNLRRMVTAPEGDWVYVPNIAERGRGTSKDNIDRGWVVGNRLSRVPWSAKGPREAISLDPRGKAVGDIEAVAVSADGKALALAAGGTHEVVLLRQPLPFIAYGGPGDHIEPDLLKDARRFQRIETGGRPVALAFRPDGASLVVADYLANALLVVEPGPPAKLRRIPLGGPETPSTARLGEAIFYDARRSHHQWYSCHSCHVEGHTNGSSFDTQNDGRYGNLKKTLSLRGVTRTGPWTWHGWQKELKPSLAHSLRTTMQGPAPTPEDVDALAAYLETVDHVPPKAKPSEASARGEALFKARGCAECHRGPDYTSPAVHRVGLEAADDMYAGFNAPALRGVVGRGPWLHDARARTLDDLFKVHHRPSALSEKTDFTDAELRDLVEFLRTL